MVLTLTMSDEGWLVTDIDFETEDGVDSELKRFLEVYPNAIELAPIASDVSPKASNGKTTEPETNAHPLTAETPSVASTPSTGINGEPLIDARTPVGSSKPTSRRHSMAILRRAQSFAKGIPAESKQIAELARLLNVQSLTIKSVYVSAPTQPTKALATSEAVKLEEKQPDGQRDGFMVLTLTMSDEGWFVTDIDFESEEGADRELERFLEDYPNAIGLAPIASNVTPKASNNNSSNPKNERIQYELVSYRFPMQGTIRSWDKPLRASPFQVHG